MDLHTAGNHCDHRLSVTDGVCQHCTCSLCFHLANQACWVMPPQRSVYHLDDCGASVRACVCVCVIHLNIYLWAIVLRCLRGSILRSVTVRQRKRGGLFSQETTPLLQKTDLPSHRGFDIKTVPYCNPFFFLKKKKEAQIHKCANELERVCTTVSSKASVVEAERGGWG